jgi:resorcinol 4-hydroxylase (FADH2)
MTKPDSDIADFMAHAGEQRPTVAQLKARLQHLLPGFAARAQATEQARRVPAESIAELREAGLFKVVQPRMFGGYEYDFDVLVDLVTDAARACASTAWVWSLFASHQWLLASFDIQAQRDIWEQDADFAICGSYAPAGMCVLADGGYRLTGRWSFASGCDNAQGAVCASMVPPRAEGQAPAPAFLLVPATEYGIDDTWDVVGLCGTGSKTLVMDNVFVPQHRVLFFRDITSGKTPGSKVHANRGFGIPMLCNIPSCLAAAAVGAASGALDAYLAATGGRVTRGAIAGASNRMAEFATVQLRVAEAAASVDCARELLLRDLRRRAATAASGDDISIEDRITSRRGQAFAVSLAIRAVEALNASTGGMGLALSNPVQRAWRDANAVGRHISLNWDAVGTMYGQMVLGLEPKGQY